MKKIFSAFMIAICCLAMAMPAQAQLIKFGVKGGLNLSKLSFSKEAKDILKSDNTTGFFVCGLLGFLFWAIPVVGLGVDGALLYSQRGENDWKQQGIEIPVNLKYTIGLGSMLGVFVAAGPDFFFNFKDMNKEGFDKKSTQVGLNLGAGVKLIKHLQIGVNYQIPLGDSFDLKELKDAGVKTKTWQISAAYIF